MKVQGASKGWATEGVVERGWEVAAQQGKEFILEAVGSLEVSRQTSFSKLFLSTVWSTDWKVESD